MVIPGQMWGAEIGFPALVWTGDGPRASLAASIRKSASHLGAVRCAEGAEYCRILVPFHTEEGVIAHGYLYAARQD
jgi:hypothetical protein